MGFFRARLQQKCVVALSLVSLTDGINMESSRLVFAVLPDTQYYSEGAPYLFDSQTSWLANNSHLMGDPFILHLGDVVQAPNVESQWVAGSEAMARYSNSME